MVTFQYRYGDPVLEMHNVSLHLGGKLVLRDINQTVLNVIRPDTTQGQVVAILGPSGRGKTKLAEIMAGLLDPVPGEVEITGQVLLNKERTPVRKGEVGFVFQNYALLDWRTVESNLLVGATQKERWLEPHWWRRPPLSPLWFANRKAAAVKAQTILDRFQLASHSRLYPDQLSGGQKQRVAIAQQLLCSDHFIIMDEPFSGLDPNMVENVAGLIQEVSLMDELNTMFVITHDVSAAVSVADTLWLVGWEKDEADVTGQNFKPGATIVKTWNLIEEDLAWHPGIVSTPRCAEFVAMIKEQFKHI